MQRAIVLKQTPPDTKHVEALFINSFWTIQRHICRFFCAVHRCLKVFILMSHVSKGKRKVLFPVLQRSSAQSRFKRKGPSSRPSTRLCKTTKVRTFLMPTSLHPNSLSIILTNKRSDALLVQENGQKWCRKWVEIKNKLNTIDGCNIRVSALQLHMRPAALSSLFKFSFCTKLKFFIWHKTRTTGKSGSSPKLQLFCFVHNWTDNYAYKYSHLHITVFSSSFLKKTVEDNSIIIIYSFMLVFAALGCVKSP